MYGERVDRISMYKTSCFTENFDKIIILNLSLGMLS